MKALKLLHALRQLRNREKLVNSLVNCIILYDDKIVITFNYENESVTIKTTQFGSKQVMFFMINILSF